MRSFADLLEVLKRNRVIDKNTDFGKAIGWTDTRLSQRVARNSIPIEELFDLCKRHHISLVKLLTEGRDDIRNDDPAASTPQPKPQVIPSETPERKEDQRSRLALREAIDKIVDSPEAAQVVTELLIGGHVDIGAVIIRQFMKRKGFKVNDKAHNHNGHA